MTKLFKNAMKTIEEDFAAGSISKDQAKERLEGKTLRRSI